VVGPIHDVHQHAGPSRHRGHRLIDARVACRGDRERATAQVRSAERARAMLDAPARGEGRQPWRHGRAHHSHVRAALEQRPGLALADLAAADDEAPSAAEIEEGREVVGQPQTAA